MLVQLPAVLKLVPDLRFRLELSEHVRTTVRNFVPVFVSRGVVQISAYIDEVLASLLAHRRRHGPRQRAAALHAARQSVRPVGVCGRAARDVGRRRPRCDARAARPREQRASARSPSSSCRRRSRSSRSATSSPRRSFRPAALRTAMRCMCGRSSPDRRSGLLATTLARLYSSTYYALRDTRTPLRYALVHVGIATVLGYLAAIVLPPMIGIEPVWGTVGSDDSRQHCRLGRAAAAAPIAERAHRPDRLAARRSACACGARRFVAAAVAWGIKLSAA